MRYGNYARNPWQSYLLIILGSIVIFFGLMAFMPMLVPIIFIVCGFWLLNLGLRMQNKPPLHFWFTRFISRTSQRFFH